jgi:hypothetical protein
LASLFNDKVATKFLRASSNALLLQYNISDKRSLSLLRSQISKSHLMVPTSIHLKRQSRKEASFFNDAFRRDFIIEEVGCRKD